MTAKRTAGLLGALAGVAAAGLAGGIAVERLVIRPRPVPDDDPYLDEPFGELPADEVRTVTTDEGVDLHVEVVEPPEPERKPRRRLFRRADTGPDLTVILVHGFALDMGTFHFQRKDLSTLTKPRLRLVAYDQPGHGKSGRLAAGDYTIDALGAALYRVIEEVAPDGPLALVGHSMGGMTIMALAEQHPELFGGRVRAVAQISSTAGELATESFGMPRLLTRARQGLLPVVAGATRHAPAVLDRARQASTQLAYALTKRFGFGPGKPSRALVRYVEKMNAGTSLEVIAGFLGTLFQHDRYDALVPISRTDVLIACGDHDLFTPLAHSEQMADLLPNAELVVIPDGGHMALLEYPEAVNGPLRKLLSRAADMGAA